MLLMAGDRVKVVESIDRYPHNVWLRENTGTVVHASKNHVQIKPDIPVEGFEEWDGCIEFYPDQIPEHNFELLFNLTRI